MVRITSITNAPRIWFAAAVMALCAVPAHAIDLMAVWQAAQAHDPQGAIADAGRAAGAAYRAQAAALWRPTVELTASAGVAGASNHMRGAQFSAPGFGQSNGVAFGTSIDAGTSTRWALSARQPLYNPQRDAQREPEPQPEAGAGQGGEEQDGEGGVHQRASGTMKSRSERPKNR